MHRRTFISTLATGSVALAGCTTSKGDGSPTDTVTPYDGSIVGTTDEPTPDQSPDETQTPTPDRNPPEPDEWTRVIDLETAPRTYALSSTRRHTCDDGEVALWFDRTATDEHPTTLTGWLRNANDYPNTFDIDGIPGVGRVHSRQPDGYDHEARLHLVPTENNDLAASVPSVSQNNDGQWVVQDVGPWMVDTHHLEPNEYARLEYRLVGEIGAPGQPTGTYTFSGQDGEVSVTVWDTNSPGPEATSRFAGRTLPEFGREETVSWYHEADQTTRAFVRPSAERLELDGVAEFEMINNSHEALECGHWDLYKLVDGEWFHVGPRGHFSLCIVLGPGGRETRQLRAFNGEPVPGASNTAGRVRLPQGYLGGGDYAVVAGYGHTTDSSGALIELTGDQVTLTPTDDPTIERGRETVTVTTDSYGDGEHPPDATVTLTRAAEADERLIAEQVMQTGWLTSDNAIRNALAVIEPGVEEVIVRTDEHAADDATGFDSTSRRFRLRGQAYEVTNSIDED